MTSFLTRRSASTLATRPAGPHLLGRPALGHLCIFPKEKLLHLFAQNLARLRIGHIKAIVIDNECALGRPQVIGLLRDMFVDALTQLAGKRRLCQAGQLAPEFDTVYHTWHMRLLVEMLPKM